jgi:hypothetical protein
MYNTLTYNQITKPDFSNCKAKTPTGLKRRGMLQITKPIWCFRFSIPSDF